MSKIILYYFNFLFLHVDVLSEIYRDANEREKTWDMPLRILCGALPPTSPLTPGEFLL